MTAPAPEKTEVVDPVTAADVPWVTIVWNDPVNLMSYVTLVFQKLLGHPRPKAEALMLDVHHKGRATVSIGRGRRWRPTSRSCRAPGCGRRWPRTADRCARSTAGSAGTPAGCEPAEASLIADLVDQVRQLLAGRRTETPADPLAAAHRDDARTVDAARPIRRSRGCCRTSTPRTPSCRPGCGCCTSRS